MGFWLKKLLGNAPPSDDSHCTLASQLSGADVRLKKWLGQHGFEERAMPARLDAAFASLQKSHAEPPPESLASDAAASLGQWIRSEWGGEWQDDPVYGELSVQGIGEMPNGKLFPLPLVERAWSDPSPDFLQGFFRAFPSRLEAERKRLEAAAPFELDRDLIRDRTDREALITATEAAQSFRRWLGSQLGQPPPLSLTGVRELDRFLRSHYYANFLSDDALVGAGFFAGEVARGLFGGTWSLDDDSPAAGAKLAWPELSYYPVGRIHKMMVERPDGEPLDEYIRLVPSARRELAGSGENR